LYIEQETDIGKIISKLKRTKNEAVSTSAKTLQAQWTTQIGISGSGSAANLNQSQDGASQSSEPEGSPDATLKKRKREDESSTASSSDASSALPISQEKKPKVEESAATVSVKKEIVMPKEKKDDKRLRIETSFVTILGTTTQENALPAQVVAAAIESALFGAYGGFTDAYREKYKSLQFNIRDKKNQRLRDILLTGELSADQLITLPPQDLANPEITAKLAKLEQEIMEKKQIAQKVATCEHFQCAKCKQNKTTYYQLQTRSADEPMTTFVECVNCGARWKF
jgi:transcription elongation factor S-II